MSEINVLSEISVAGVESDSVDKAPNMCRISYFDVFALLYAIIFHLVDSVFDIYLAHSYYATGQYSYFAWTVAFIAVPSIIMSGISIRMYIEDSKDSLLNFKTLFRPILCIIGSVLQLATVIRYFDSLRYAKKCLKAESQGNKKLQESCYKEMLKEDSDAALLRVFECYIEAAFQQVLQLTLLFIDYTHGHHTHFIKQCIMLTLSFTSMGWCMATYNRCIRFDRDDKQNISTMGTIIQFFWHMNLTVSRIFALTAISILYPFWASISIACHWCIMTIWVAVTSKTNFCGKSLILEVFFSGTIGLIYIFNFISLKDGPTRKSYFVFFLFCGFENLMASVIWGINSPLSITNWPYYVFLLLPLSTLGLSVIFLVLYYSIYHPTKSPNRLKVSKKTFYGCHLQSRVFDEDAKLDDKESN